MSWCGSSARTASRWRPCARARSPRGRSTRRGGAGSPGGALRRGATRWPSTRRAPSAGAPSRRPSHSGLTLVSRVRAVLLASLSSSFTSAVANHGVYAVFGLMAIDALFPAASELVMLYAGAVAAGVFSSAHRLAGVGSRGGFGGRAYVALALAGTLGYLVGALIGWAIGRYGGRPLLERHGRWFHLSPERLDRAEAWFERWGNLAVFIGRVTPVVRSFVSIAAGVFEM